MVVAELDAALGQEAARGITAAGGQAEFVACDVSSEEQIVALVAHTAEKYGTVDILINNAGIADPHAASLYELSADVWDKVLNTNARSVFLATREAAKHMRSNPGGGSVVNLSSTRALMSEPDTEAYAASKGR